MTVKFKLYYILLTKQPIPQLVWKSKKTEVIPFMKCSHRGPFSDCKRGYNKRVKIDNV
jgi:hypothetical protein